MLKGKVIGLGSDRFGFEYISTHYNKPVSFRQVWEISSVTMKRMSYCEAKDAINREGSITDGFVSCYLGNGNWFYGALEKGGQTPSIILEETEVPRPKARGAETRWQNGRWEKLLRKGWVPA